jgi:hypothetical protein
VSLNGAALPPSSSVVRSTDADEQGRFELEDIPTTYRVAIPAEWIDDSRVSITFLTIQPDHDAWVKSFFREGKGGGYKGFWTSDGGILPAIPLAPQGGE